MSKFEELVSNFNKIEIPDTIKLYELQDEIIKLKAQVDDSEYSQERNALILKYNEAVVAYRRLYDSIDWESMNQKNKLKQEILTTKVENIELSKKLMKENN